ncbi:MAG: thiamine-phosphate kinase [Bacteroidales bacterium]|nr:thiamine-phosphate kinase [Candidatus Colimorpha onthohippi]
MSKKLSEFDLIDKIKTMFPTPQNMIGIGDDCAIIPQASGFDTLVSTDLLIEGVHFLRQDIQPTLLGWKAAAVNLSDIAAMGGKPIGTFLSVALPSDCSQEWIDQFLEGYHDISSCYNVSLLGGDTTRSLNTICINVGVVGTVPHGKALQRNTAQVGDLICVTGPLGDAAAGLKIILSQLPRLDHESALVLRHYHPMPRIEEGITLAATPGVHAMMDISDGIASDLRHIVKASQVGADVDVERLPFSNELLSVCQKYNWDRVQLALEGGEDYELLFTMDPQCHPAVQYHTIGQITDSNTIQWIGGNRTYEGFSHF